MKCIDCGQLLWNLRNDRCPECGRTFSPADWTFDLDTVEFCCLRCGSAHRVAELDPSFPQSPFHCRGCGGEFPASAVLIRPLVQSGAVPWLERRRIERLDRLVIAWCATVWMSMRSPRRFSQAMPGRTSIAPAVVYALIVLSIALLGQVISLGAMMQSGFGGMQTIATVSELLQIFMILLVVTVAVVTACVLVSHAILRLTGRTLEGVHRTREAVLMSSGPMILAVHPVLLPVGFIGWMIVAVRVLAARQRVSMWRAVAAIVLPVVMALGTCAGSILALRGNDAARRLVLAQSNKNAYYLKDHVARMGNAILSYAGDHGGSGPPHAALLWTSEAQASQRQSIAFLDPAGPFALPQSKPTALQRRLSKLDEEARLQDARELAAALDRDAVAHRVGDYVFVYHGMDLNGADPELWIAVAHYPLEDKVLVALADGTVRRYGAEFLPGSITAQNRLRASYGLAPLPADLLSIEELE